MTLIRESGDVEAKHGALIDERVGRKVSPDGRNHAEPLVLIESKGKSTGFDPDNVSDFENRLEADSLLSDGPFAMVVYVFGAVGNGTYGSDILRLETFFVAPYPQVCILVFILMEDDS